MTKDNIQTIIICFFVLIITLVDFNYAAGATSTTTLYDVLITDRDFTKRKNAARALGDIKDKQAVEYLINALNIEEYYDSRDIEVRIESAIALGKIGGKEAIDALNKRALSENDLEAKKAIAKALMKIGDDSSIPSLTFLIKDSIPDVSNVAVNALEEVRKRLSLGEKGNQEKEKLKEEKIAENNSMESIFLRVYHLLTRWGASCLLLGYLILIGFILFTIIFIDVTDSWELCKRISSFVFGVTICTFLQKYDKILIIGSVLERMSLSFLFFLSFSFGLSLIFFLDIIRRNFKIENIGYNVFVLFVSTAVGLQTVFYFQSDSLKNISAIISFGMIFGSLLYWIFFFRNIEKQDNKKPLSK